LVRKEIAEGRKAGRKSKKQTNKQNKTKQKPGPPLAKGLDPPQVQTDVKGIVVGYC